MSTTKEMLITLNALRVKNGKTELAGWKAGRDKLNAAIDAEQATQVNKWYAEGEELTPEEQAEIGSELTDLTSDAEKPATEEKAPRGAIGALVIELLVTEMPYADIVAQVKETYPSAKTTARSIASVAMDLRRAGIEVPSRRKPAAPKPAKAA